MFVKKSDQQVHILWMIYVALRRPECTILHPHIQKISGGALSVLAIKVTLNLPPSYAPVGV